METFAENARAAVLDPDRCDAYFRQLKYDHVFEPGNFHVTVHRVSKYMDQSTDHGEHELHSMKDFSRIATALTVAPAAARQRQRIASFQLIHVHRASRAEFLALFDSCGLDAAALLVLNSGPFHFQCFEARETASGSEGVSFGMAYNVASVLWHYNWQDASIRAIAIAQSPYVLTKDHFDRFKDDIMHPLSFPVVALQTHLETLHRIVHRLPESLNRVEAQTKYSGKYTTARPDATTGMDLTNYRIPSNETLAWMAQVISESQYSAFSCERGFERTHAILEEISRLLETPRYAHGLGQGLNGWPDTHALQTTVRWRLKFVDSLLQQTRFLSNRIRVQNTLIFNLTTQRDAQVGIALTEAAKRDSSSMRTIAVMTMAILPATFFAALFAMPLFKWDESPVIQSQFWIYLAFTMPSTAIVFLVWVVSDRVQTLGKQWSDSHKLRHLGRS